MNFAEARGIDVRVYLRGRDVRVAEKLLDGPYVRPVREHVRGEGMPEDVRRNPGGIDPGRGRPILDYLENPLARELAPEPRHKDVTRANEFPPLRAGDEVSVCFAPAKTVEF